MTTQNNPLADQLLGKLADPAQLARYREQVTRSLKHEQKRLQFQRVATLTLWMICAVSATAWIWFSTSASIIPRGQMAAGILLVCGAVEILKHAVSAGRFEVLMEIKQVQLQVFDLEQQLRLLSSLQP